MENKLITVGQKEFYALDSREVAEMMGKDHGKLIRMINGSKDGKDIGIKKDILVPLGENIEEYFIPDTYKTDKNNKSYNMYWITKKGVLQLINKVRRDSNIVKLVEYYNKYLSDDDNIICKVVKNRIEIEFLNLLQQVLNPLNYIIEYQYNVDGYRIDGYISELKLAIEYDELQHDRQQKEDEEREEYIKNKLGCTFVRCSIRNNHYYNIGLVMKEIIKLLKKNSLKM